MGKWGWSREHPEQHPFENNPFIDGLFEHMDSPEGELSSEVSETLWPILQTLKLDAKQRQLIWPDGKRLGLDESVQHIHTDYPNFPREFIETRLISWLDSEYAPESYSPEQLDELDRLTERWINDYSRRSGGR
jgi:hypothetical protein